MAPISERYVIGVDVGGTSTAIGLVNSALDVIEVIEQKTDTSGQDALLQEILTAVGRLRDRSPAAVAAVGMGFPSMIDQSRGRAVMSVNIPLSDFDIVEYMHGQLRLPVFIDNDANLAALAELRAGKMQGIRDGLMITVGTGIGGGIIIGGEVYRGTTGCGAELGHIVIDVNGPPCQGACPNNGCFETMASGTALVRYANELAGEHRDSQLAKSVAGGAVPDGALVSRLAATGDPVAGEVLSRIGYYIGVGITSLVNVFNPEVFVLGGGVMQAGDAILNPALEYLHTRGLKPSRDVVKVVTPRFGPEAGMIGAAALALDGISRRV